MSVEKGKAEALAERLETYWLHRGYVVRAWAEPVTFRRNGEAHSVWVVKSDMVNGKPVRRAGE